MLLDAAEQLIGKGIDLCIYDPNVSIARLTGANKEYINRTIPHLARLLVASMDEAVASADLVIVGHNYPGIEAVRANDAAYHLLDLTGQIQFVARAAAVTA